MNNITIRPAIFNFNTHSVRTIVKDGEPWFVASDVCKALGYANTSKAVGDHLDSDERMIALVPRTSNDSLGVETNIINESGLYALVLRSRKPEARKFAKWVTSEVLPAIRRTGAYQVDAGVRIMDELRQRINRRAWELAHAEYDNYRTAMIRAANKTGYAQFSPEAWSPALEHGEILKGIETLAFTAEMFKNRFIRDRQKLAAMFGMDLPDPGLLEMQK